ncbi:MAG: hypothetical protein KF745_11455 [Phycisphaeraceae bacterium]|nr:hypothetical protein [Phycisphaeraceae bacterium]
MNTRRFSPDRSRPIMCVLLLGMAMLFLPACAQRSLSAVRESGERHYVAGQYSEAIVDFQEYVERLPGDPVGQYNLGRAYLKVTPPRPVPAREHLWLAYPQRMNDPAVVDALCDALVAGDRDEELYKLLRQRALDRQQVSDYLRLARYAQELGDADEARQALVMAARLDEGQTVEVQLAMVDFYSSIGDKDQAVRRLRMAYYLNPRDTRVAERMKTLNAVTGPTFAIKPDEAP